MAAEFLLVTKVKYDQMEQDANTYRNQLLLSSAASTSSTPLSPPPPPPPATQPTTISQLRKGNHSGAQKDGTSGDNVASTNTGSGEGGGGGGGGGDQLSRATAHPRISAQTTTASAESNTNASSSHRDQLIPAVSITRENGASEKVNSSEQSTSSADNELDYSVDDVVNSFNQSELKYIHSIIKLMNEKPDVMSWDMNTGEIKLQGVAEKGTNVIELLKDSLIGNIHPRGKMEFLRGLAMLGVKVQALKNAKYKGILRSIRGKAVQTENKHDGKKSADKNIKSKTKPVKRLTRVKKLKGWLVWE